MNTRPQQFSRTLKPAHRLRQRIPENHKISWDTVGYRTLQMIPDPFIGIQFRRVGRESTGANFGMFFQPLLGLSRLVRHTAIPEQNKTFRQMSFEMFQEFNHLRPTDVLLGMQSNVKVNPFTLWRHADRRDGRNLTPTARGGQDRHLSLGRPRSLHRRNQRKAALVKKHQRNSSTQSVFLYAANDTFSNSALPVRSSPAPFSRAFGNSSLTQSRLSKYVWDDTRPLSADLLPRRSFSLSTTLSNTRSSSLLATKSQPTSCAAFLSASLAVPGLFLILTLLLLAVHTALAMYTPNLQNTLAFGLLPAFLVPVSATRSRAGVASQVAFGFHVVSWNQINTSFNHFLLLLRKSIFNGENRVHAPHNPAG